MYQRLLDISLTLFFLYIICITIYQTYELYHLTLYDEKCFHYEKIIGDKITLETDSNEYIDKQNKEIYDIFKKNPKCFFHKININSHKYKNDIKSEFIFKCYC